MNEPMNPQRLSELLSSAANDVPMGDDGMTRIGQGISRRRRMHQTLAVGGTSLAVIAVVLFGFILRPENASHVVPPPVGQSSLPTTEPSASPTASPADTHPLPAGFQARSVSSLGQRWWVLGDTSIEATSDGGSTYETLTLPGGWKPLAGAGENPSGIAFVDATHGVVWQAGGQWATDDGGSHWSGRVSSAPATMNVIDSVRVDGVVYLLASQCATASQQSCTTVLTTYDGIGVTMEDQSVPVAAGEIARSIAVASETIWILALDGSGAPGHVLKSTDRGKTFTSTPHSDGCLTGSLTAVSDADVYEICVSGMAASLRRSSDGGKSFAAIPSKQSISNQASMLASPGGTGVLSPGAGLLRTTDGFKTFVDVGAPSPTQSASLQPGSRSEQMFALESTDTGIRLWVSLNAGQTWKSVN